MRELTYEEQSLLTKPTPRYFGDSNWGRNPIVRCYYCKRKTDKIHIKNIKLNNQLVCTRHITKYLRRSNGKR